MKKFIFLDIDGVINSEAWHSRYIKEFIYDSDIDMELDIEAIQRINKIIKETGAEVVISSSWRFDMRGTYDRLVRSGLIVRPSLRIEGHEFSISDDSPTRGDLIEKFLEKHPCDRFIILDDDEDMTDTQQPFFIKTSWSTGITEKDTEKAIEILNS